MTRKNLISLIALDIFVMLLAVSLMIYRYRVLTVLPVSAAKGVVEHTESVPVTVPVEAPKLAAAAPQATAAPNVNTGPRNVFFTYRNSKAKNVAVIGDFTDWVPRKLDKGPNYTWKITFPLAPGDYAYNFVVDGKPRRDPNNPKVCDKGRGFPNSFLKVKPLSSDN